MPPLGTLVARDLLKCNGVGNRYVRNMLQNFQDETIAAVIFIQRGKQHIHETVPDEPENQRGPKPYLFDGRSHATHRHGHAKS